MHYPWHLLWISCKLLHVFPAMEYYISELNKKDQSIKVSRNWLKNQKVRPRTLSTFNLGRANSLTCCQFMKAWAGLFTTSSKPHAYEMLRNPMEQSQNCCHTVMIPQKNISFNVFVLFLTVNKRWTQPPSEEPNVQLESLHWINNSRGVKCSRITMLLYRIITSKDVL